MMLQFISINTDSLLFYKQILNLQGFTASIFFLRKPCSYNGVTLLSKMIPKMYQF